ncbi:hypothetical protein ACHAWF_018602, partial [Thalassiosira exigua]
MIAVRHRHGQSSIRRRDAPQVDLASEGEPRRPRPRARARGGGVGAERDVDVARGDADEEGHRRRVPGGGQVGRGQGAHGDFLISPAPVVVGVCCGDRPSVDPSVAVVPCRRGPLRYDLWLCGLVA